MSKYHITKSGEAAKCTATVKACPLGAHYESQQDAYRAIAEPATLSSMESNKAEGEQSDAEIKLKQFELVHRLNPMTDSYHVGIRSVDDVLTLREAFDKDVKNEELNLWNDQPEAMYLKAFESGVITIYSSKDIEAGNFVSTSYNEAEMYAGSGYVRKMEVPLHDVAWISSSEGQYAPVSDTADENTAGATDVIAEQKDYLGPRFANESDASITELHEAALWAEANYYDEEPNLHPYLEDMSCTELIDYLEDNDDSETGISGYDDYMDVYQEVAWRLENGPMTSRRAMVQALQAHTRVGGYRFSWREHFADELQQADEDLWEERVRDAVDERRETRQTFNHAASEILGGRLNPLDAAFYATDFMEHSLLDERGVPKSHEREYLADRPERVEYLRHKHSADVEEFLRLKREGKFD